jgi:hypothetical protein
MGSVWLPIGSTNFSHFFRDRVAQQEPAANDVSELPRRSPEAALDTSVLSRLWDTLGRSGYDLCVPLSSAEDREHAGSVVFYASEPRTSAGVALPTLAETLLIVSEDGFLTWIVPGGEVAHVWKRLEDHVLDLFGDISHEGDRTPGSRNIKLSDYASKGGILNYFQLNIILEGLWNRNFQLDYFFSDRRSDADLNRRVRGSYSIPSFIAPLLVKITPTDALEALAGLAVRALRFGTTDVPACVEACAALSDHLSSAAAKADRCTVLLRFLRVTKDRSLLQTKIRIEICRRALVQELLGVAHRVQPVEQIVSPDVESETLESVSESQLRGYLMLIAAKLPIAQNLSLYLNEVVQLFNDRDSDSPDSAELTLLEREFAAWSALLESVADNVKSLERAVAQSSRDRALYEQEQVRAENETLAEIERLRDSDPGDSAPSLEDSSFSALEVAIALAVSFAAAGKLFHGWNVLWLAPTLILGFIVVFMLMHKGATKLLHATRIRQWIKSPMSGRVFYELDLRVDGYIEAPVAEGLIEGPGFPPDWDGAFTTAGRSRVVEQIDLPT